jgi:lipid-A-disaccharide synthase
MDSCDLYVLAGERSGDTYAAAVVAGLRARHAGLRCAGIGLDGMRQAGVSLDADMTGLALMGFLPVLARLGRFRRLLRDTEAAIRARRPRVVLTVDYPGFNLRLLHRLQDLRAHGTRFVHLVAPQVWAWKPRRAKAVARDVDRLLCFFPFEPPLFQRHGGDARCIGHPLVDLAAGASEQEQRRPLLLLAPGSRRKEIEGLLPVFLHAVSLVRAIHPDLECRIAGVRSVPVETYAAARDIDIVFDRYQELCREARVALVASGTATLEAGLLGCPHALAYPVSPLTRALARRLVLTQHIGLINIVWDRRVTREFVGRSCRAEALAAEILRLWQGPWRQRQEAILAATPARLGGPGALLRAVEEVAQILS